MAYADSPSIGVEFTFPPKPAPKRRRAKRTKAPTEASIWPQNRTAGITKRKVASIIRAAAARIGRALLEGLLDPPAKPKPKPVDPILLAVDRAPQVRALVGRVDVSGDSDGASWAKIIQGARGPELHVWYRHGREVLSELMGAVEAAITAVGAKIRTLWKRIERARQYGGSAFVAVIPLLADVSPPKPAKVTKKSRPKGNLSARRRATA